MGRKNKKRLPSTAIEEPVASSPPDPVAEAPVSPPPPDRVAERAVPPFLTPCLDAACGSTDRTDYELINETEFTGMDADGKPYTHVLFYRCNCLACGQARTHRCFENRS
jgi:hypothetical protein